MHKIYFLSIITFILSILISIVIGSSAIGVSLILFLLFATFFCFFLGNKKYDDVNNLLTVLNVSFFFYIFYAVLANASYLEYNSFFLFPDQTALYQNSEELGRKESINEIYKLCFIDRIHYEMEGFYFIMGLISYLANTFFDGNSVLLQSLHISFLAIIANLLMYKFLQKNGIQEKLQKFTLIYSLLSPIFYYSPWILRDIHIAFLFILSLLLISSKFTIRRLFFLIVLIYITFEFRVENGLFMLLFVFYYIIFKAKHHSHYKLIISLIIFLTIIFLPFTIKILSPKFVSTIVSLDNYKSYTLDGIESQGLGRYIYQLPFGIKQIAIVFYSQLTQFPPWATLEIAANPNQILIGIGAFIKSIFWSLLFLTSILSIFFRNARKTLSKELIILLLFFVIYLFLNSSNINDRRLYAMYPILFLYITNLSLKLNKKYFNAFLKDAVIIYFIILLLYTFVKYV